MPRLRHSQQDRSAKRHKPFQPAIGKELEGVEEVEAKTRDYIARVIASTTVAAVGVSGFYGLITGNFGAVIGVWSVAGPIIGALVAYYFGPPRHDTR